MSLPDALLGSALKAYFNQNYTSGTGTFVDDKGNAVNLTQSTSGSRPTWNTATAPSGRGLLSFPGGGVHVLTGGDIASGAVGAFGSFYFVEFCIIKTTSNGSDSERAIDYNGDDYLLLNFGPLWRWGALSNASPLGTSVHRVIAVTDLSGTVTLYIDGTAQTTTGSTTSGVGGVRDNWTNAKGVGNRMNGSAPYGGLIGCIGFAQQASWSGTDTSNLDAAINEWWTTAAGGGWTTGQNGNLAVFPNELPNDRRVKQFSMYRQQAAASAENILPLPKTVPNLAGDTTVDPDYSEEGRLFRERRLLSSERIIASGTEVVFPWRDRKSPLAVSESPSVLNRATLPSALHAAASGTEIVFPWRDRVAPLSDAEFPDRIGRSLFGVALQASAPSTPDTIDVVVAPFDPSSRQQSVAFPDRIYRFAFGAASQDVGATSPVPEQTGPIADPIFPDRLSRPAFAAAEQLAITESSPRPERTAVLFDAEFPDRAPRLTLRPALQLASTANALPILALPPLARPVLPDAIRRTSTRTDSYVFAAPAPAASITFDLVEAPWSTARRFGWVDTCTRQPILPFGPDLFGSLLEQDYPAAVTSLRGMWALSGAIIAITPSGVLSSLVAYFQTSTVGSMSEYAASTVASETAVTSRVSGSYEDASTVALGIVYERSAVVA